VGHVGVGGERGRSAQAMASRKAGTGWYGGGEGGGREGGREGVRETGPEAADLSGEWTLALNVGGQQGREEEPHLQQKKM
jgi:hypothetical protein